MCIYIIWCCFTSFHITLCRIALVLDYAVLMQHNTAQHNTTQHPPQHTIICYNTIYYEHT